MDKITLSSKFASFSDHWSPNTGNVQSDRTVAEPARI